MRIRILGWVAGAALVQAAACAPVENQRGYVPDNTAVSGIEVGMDTKDSVSEKLGQPSTSATFGNDTWYYVSAHVEQNGFFAQRARNRNIVAVEFAPDGKVADIQRFTLADGRVVSHVGRETPTLGRTQTLLQQIFNAVPGRVGAPTPTNGPNGPMPGPGAPPP
jgi:outer membrane protein assembly factor BamE (lipoprotein component of BamABCDE complex)